MNIREKVEALPVRRDPSGIDWLVRDDVLAILGKPHMHTAKYKDGKLLDKCGLCGWDLRDDVHSLERRGEG